MTRNKLIMMLFLLPFFTSHVTHTSEISEPNNSFFNTLTDLFFSAQLPETTRSTPAAAAALDVFFTQANISEVLDTHLYLKTHPANYRNIIQNPLFINSTTVYSNNGWSFNFFFNRDYSRNFTSSEDNVDSKRVTSYMDLKNDTILEAMESVKNDPTVAAALSNYPDFSIPNMFDLFAPMTLQEHRLGLLAHYHTTWNDIGIDISLPFLWAERNFYFTDEEKELIYNNDLLALLGEVDEWEFAKEYFISDQIGFGTLEATFSTDLIRGETARIKGGLKLYFPTEIALKKGVLGTYRELKSDRPSLDICSLVNDAGNEFLSGWEEKITAYFAEGYTRFASNLLHTPLGFDGHPGLAIEISPIWDITSRWSWRSSYSLDYLIPMYKDRLFINIPENDTEITQLFNDNKNDGGTPIDIRNKRSVEIIETALTDRLFPVLDHVLIQPGVMFNATSTLEYHKREWRYSIGYNTWLQLREEILQNSLSQSDRWNIAAAEKPFSSQFKVFGKIEKTIHSESRDWKIAAYLDYSISSECLGNDFLINLQIQGTF